MKWSGELLNEDWASLTERGFTGRGSGRLVDSGVRFDEHEEMGEEMSTRLWDLKREISAWERFCGRLEAVRIAHR